MQSTATVPTTYSDANSSMYVTMWVDKQMFGIEVKNVRDVLRQQKVTPIPLAPAQVAGSLNLRGRIVTVIDMRKRLQLPKKDGAANTFVVIDLKGELYSLMIDNVGEVLTIGSESIEKTPANMSAAWKDISTGIFKLENELLVLVDVQTLLKI